MDTLSRRNRLAAVIFVCAASSVEAQTPLRYPEVRGGQIRIEGYLVPQVTSWPSCGTTLSSTVFFEGKKLFEVEDGTFTGAGRVGLWTKADSVTYFDDFQVRAK